MDLLQGKQAVRNAQQDLMDLLQGKQAVRNVLPILITLSPEEVNVLHAHKDTPPLQDRLVLRHVPFVLQVNMSTAPLVIVRIVQ